MSNPETLQNTPSKVSCAVIYAGDSVTVAIPLRQGRYPVTVTELTPKIKWRSHDGVLEQLCLDGPTGNADHARIKAEIEGDELLIAEVGDMSKVKLDAASHWLMGVAPQRPMERQS